METTRSEKTPPGDSGGREYALGHSDPELERLTVQARLLDPFTRALLRDAGVREGMRVLDLGCGYGDVSLLAAELVGPLGHVVGLDSAPVAVDAARRRTAALPNVEVVHGDLTQATFDAPFDAAVGRLVLMYCPDPIEALSAVARWVRPGGPVGPPRVRPSGRPQPAPGAALRGDAQAHHRGGQARRRQHRHGLGAPPRVPGRRPARARHPVRGGGQPPDDTAAFEMLAGLLRSVLPAVERFGLGRPEDLKVETLARRMREEVENLDAVVAYPPLVGAYARRTSRAAA